MGRPTRRVLWVDIDLDDRTRFDRVLSRSYSVRRASTAEQAISLAGSWHPDLVLLDVPNATADSFEMCRRLKASGAQVIMVSAATSTIEQAVVFGMNADDYMVKPVEPAELLSRLELHVSLCENKLATAALQLHVDGQNEVALRVAREGALQTIAVQDVAVFTLAKVCELRDNETGEHIIRMRQYSQRLAEELQRESPYAEQIDATFLSDLYRSSPLHDIGKVGISDTILLKPSRLTRDEFETMKRHTVIGGSILQEAVMQLQGGGFLTMAAKIALYHHERWDGTGYLSGLAGDEIPLPARIVSVADVFDALTSARPYKRAWSAEEAKKLIDEAAGTQFDPHVVAAFDHCFDDLLRIRRRYSDNGELAVGAMSFVEYELIDA